jgi:Predicted nucleotide-utilizing enzyme related to molybdopterin-biosynthesis enzyme MoeA
LGFTVSASLRRVALKLSNGKIIDNPIGTARGLHVSSNKKEIIALPGVPSEMKSMMREATLPMNKKISQKSIHSSILRTTGITESSSMKNFFP